MRNIWAGATHYPWVAVSVGIGAVGLGLLLVGAHDFSSWIVGGWAAIVAAWEALSMLRALLRGHLGLDVLAVTAITATLAVGDVWAAFVVVLMLTGGEALEAFAERRARREVSALLERSPRIAHRSDGHGGTLDVPVDDIVVGDGLIIKPGEMVPVDAMLLTAEAVIDESSLTGESVPVTRTMGETLMSGSVNGGTAISVRASAPASESEYQRIVALVSEASSSKAPFIRLADRYAVPFTLFALTLGGLAWWLSGEPQRFAEVLVVATPCPLLIAAPVAFIGGMSQAAKTGVIIKNGGSLEQLARVRTAAFDKTGTLTSGQPRLERTVRIDGYAGCSEAELLQFAASAEALSPHVLARALIGAVDTLLPTGSVEEIPGHGVIAEVAGRQVVVGKASFVADQTRAFTPHPLEPGEMSMYVGIDGEPAGQFILRDEVRANAAETLRELERLGVGTTVMLTGDAPTTAQHVAYSLGISDVRASMLPSDKVAAVHALPNRPVVMVGDGVNDAPVLAAADIGVAMGAAGATAASESASVVVLVDDISRIASTVAISQRTIRVALQSIWLGLAMSIGLMLVAAFGVIPAIIGALLQELVDLVTILNSLRAATPARGTSSTRPQP